MPHSYIKDFYIKCFILVRATQEESQALPLWLVVRVGKESYSEKSYRVFYWNFPCQPVNLCDTAIVHDCLHGGFFHNESVPRINIGLISCTRAGNHWDKNSKWYFPRVTLVAHKFPRWDSWWFQKQALGMNAKLRTMKKLLLLMK